MKSIKELLILNYADHYRGIIITDERLKADYSPERWSDEHVADDILVSLRFSDAMSRLIRPHYLTVR